MTCSVAQGPPVTVVREVMVFWLKDVDRCVDDSQDLVMHLHEANTEI